VVKKQVRSTREAQTSNHIQVGKKKDLCLSFLKVLHRFSQRKQIIFDAFRLASDTIHFFKELIIDIIKGGINNEAPFWILLKEIHAHFDLVSCQNALPFIERMKAAEGTHI
jgi:hypothetical protein